MTCEYRIIEPQAKAIVFLDEREVLWFAQNFTKNENEMSENRIFLEPILQGEI